MPTNVVTLGEVIELAKLGRVYVELQAQRNIMLWLGRLPTERELELCEQELGKLIPSPGEIPARARVVWWGE